MNNVYLDNNATTQVAPEVIDAMLPFFKELWGNPSSMHYFGGQVGRYVEEARNHVAALLGAKLEHVERFSCIEIHVEPDLVRKGHTVLGNV